MASEVERLIVSLEASAKKFENEMRRASGVAQSNLSQIEKRTEQSAKRIENLMGTAASKIALGFKSLAAGASAYLSVDALRRYADAWTDAGNKIAASGEETGRVAARQSQLADLAMRTRSEFATTVDLYTGLTRSTADLGATQAQVLKVTETINKAFVVGGQSTATAAGAIQQLNQAFAAGKLSGDELNSVLEGAPPIARLVAKEFGITVGQLKKFAEEGKLTSDRVFQAILNGSRQIDEEFARTNSSISQSFTNLDTAITRYIGQADQAGGASAKIAGGINSIANNMEAAAPIAVALGAALAAAFVGGPIAGGIAGVATALTLFSDSIRPISGEMATLGDYARAAFDIVSTMSGTAAETLRGAFAGAADVVAQSLAAIGTDGGQAFDLLLQAVKATANALIGAFAFAAQTIKATWDTLGFAMAEAVVSAVNAAIQAIERLANSAVSAINSVTSGINSVLQTSIGQVGNVDLGRVTNAYAGAGAAAGKAYKGAFDQLTKDHIGNALGSVSKAAQQFRDDVNLRAADRAEQARRNNQAIYRPNDGGGSLNKALIKPAGGDDGGGKGKKERLNEYQREIRAIEERTRALDAERQTIGMSAGDVAKAEAQFRLLEAAKAANIAITPELTAQIEQVATAYGQATQTMEDARERQEQIADAMQEIGSVLSNAFQDAILEGEALDKVLQKLLKSLASKAIDSLFSSMFDPGGGLLKALGFGTGKAEGGAVYPGRAYTVGESGRETFVPTTPGRIIPNGKTGGGSATIAPVYNIDARGSSMSEAQFRAILAENNRALMKTVPGYLTNHNLRSF